MKKLFLFKKTSFSLLIVLISLLSIGSADAQYLDNLSDAWSKAPTAAYSTRKVMSTYAGLAMRLRRSNDNVETDVFFDTNGWVSLASNVGSAGSGNMLVDWVGVNSAYVTKWYDQSGNGNDATPAECTWAITCTTSSTTVTGSGTTLSTELTVGTMIYDATDGAYIATVASGLGANSFIASENPTRAISAGKVFTQDSHSSFINGGVIIQHYFQVFEQFCFYYKLYCINTFP